MIVVGTTIPPYKSGSEQTSEWGAWVSNLEAVADDAAEVGEDIRVFVALEVDNRGSFVHSRLFNVLRASGLPYDSWKFMLDDGAEQVTSGNRLQRICTGRNMVIEFAMRIGAEWILFLDSDTTPDPQTVSKLKALDWPIVGGEVAEYCLHGPEVKERPQCHCGIPRCSWHRDDTDRPPPYDFPVEDHWNTAGYLLVHRDIFTKVRWGWDSDAGMTDDPWYQQRVTDVTGFHTLVRKDCVGQHVPLVPLEAREQDTFLRRAIV